MPEVCHPRLSNVFYALGLTQLALKQTPIEKYLYLSTIRKNNVHLFYRLITDHIQVSSSEAIGDNVKY